MLIYIVPSFGNLVSSKYDFFQETQKTDSDFKRSPTTYKILITQFRGKFVNIKVAKSVMNT